MATLVSCLQSATGARETPGDEQALGGGVPERRLSSRGRSSRSISAESSGRDGSGRRGTSRSFTTRMTQELDGLSISELRAKLMQSEKDLKDYARSLCKKKVIEEAKRKQWIEEAINRLEGPVPGERRCTV